jgi:hypothetical protein
MTSDPTALTAEIRKRRAEQGIDVERELDRPIASSVYPAPGSPLVQTQPTATFLVRVDLQPALYSGGVSDEAAEALARTIEIAVIGHMRVLGVGAAHAVLATR